MKDFIEKIRLQDETVLLTYMEQAFNASAINELLAFKDKQEKDRFLSSYVRGYHLPLSPQIGGRLHTVSQEILKLFEFTGRPVTFYINNNPEFNAAAHFNHNEDEPHFIVLNSGLVDKLTEDEMRFVIGHELGHLIYAHSVFNRIIEFIYPEEAPPFLTSIYRLWRNLSEMSADRVGLLAVTDFETALSAMFKMSCGLDMMRFQVNTSNFMSMTDGIITDMMTSPQNFLGDTHPTNPVRIKSLEVFYHSKLRQSFLTKRLYIKDSKLTKKTDELISLLQKHPTGDAEHAKLDFLAAAG
jgi:Zn-dependent protease with chaperone function